MSLAFYIVLEQELALFDPLVDGKALAHAPEPELTMLAERLGVPPLISFFGAEPDEMDLLADEGVEDDFAGIGMPQLQWFDADAGLTTVRALLRHLEQSPGDLANAPIIVGDLQAFERVLGEAAARKIRWHLAIE